jgi:Flp pilus assembly protein TadD
MTTEAALELLRHGDSAGALALLGDALGPHEIDPARLVARGMVQLANQRPAEALTALRMAVALDDTSPTTVNSLAIMTP